MFELSGAVMAVLALILVWRSDSKRRWAHALPLVVLFSCLAIVSGCATGPNSEGGGGNTGGSGTPAGTSTITVTATSGTLVQTTHVTLTVN